MKKPALSLLLALALCFSLASSVFAAEQPAWSEAYRNFVMNGAYLTEALPTAYPAESPWGNETERFVTLHDLDLDGVPELLFSNGYAGKVVRATYIYTYAGGKVIYIGTGPSVYTTLAAGSRFGGLFGSYRNDNLETLVTYYEKRGNALYSELVSFAPSDFEAPVCKTENTALFHAYSTEEKAAIPAMSTDEIQSVGWNAFVSAHAADWGISSEPHGSCGENVTWSLNQGSGVLTVRGSGAMEDYQQKYGGDGLDSYSTAPWWDYRHQIRQVVVEQGVTHIGSHAFASYDNAMDNTCLYDALESVAIAGSVLSIGDSAFALSTALTELRLSDGLRSIGDYAFWECYNLPSYTIPGTVVSIGECAFQNIMKVTSVTIPDSVQEIGDCAIGYTFSQAEYPPPKVDGFVITGYAGTAGEAYATANGFPFIQADTLENPADFMAYASALTVSIDGNAVELPAYALKDENGYPTNYVKLRDVAHVLNGTAAQFDVSWDGNVNIVTNSPYVSPNGSEMKTPFTGDRAYTVPTAVTNIDGAAADLAAIYLTDDSGGGYTYYQLRDLGRALGFNVGWSAERGIFIETDKPYTDAD